MVPRSMPTTLLMIRRSPRLVPLDSRAQLPFDAREQVVDVVALEHAIAQRVRARPGARRPARRASTQRVPARRQLLQLLLVLGALGLDRLARALEPRAATASAGAPLARSSRISSSSSFSANTSSSSAGGTCFDASSGSSRGQPFELQQVLDPRDRLLAACDTRRSDTTTARGSRAARPACAL